MKVTIILLSKIFPRRPIFDLFEMLGEIGNSVFPFLFYKLQNFISNLTQIFADFEQRHSYLVIEVFYSLKKTVLEP